VKKRDIKDIRRKRNTPKSAPLPFKASPFTNFLYAKSKTAGKLKRNVRYVSHWKYPPWKNAVKAIGTREKTNISIFRTLPSFTSFLATLFSFLSSLNYKQYTKISFRI